MKSFQSYLQEDVTKAAWYDKTYNMLVQSFMNSESIMVPLSNTLISKLTPRPIEVTVFHKTNLDGLQAIVKMQKSSKAISTASRIFLQSLPRPDAEDVLGSIQAKDFFNGVHRSGIVLKVRGRLLSYTKWDAMSLPDSNGRRWIGINDLFPRGSSQISLEISKKVKAAFSRFVLPYWEEIREFFDESQLDPMKSSAVLKTPHQKAGYILNIINNAPGSMWISLSSQEKAINMVFPKLKSELIAKYYDLVNTVVSKYADRINFTSLVQDMAKEKSGKAFISSYGYDEVVVNKLEILSPVYYDSGKYSDTDVLAAVGKNSGLEFIGIDTMKGIFALGLLTTEQKAQFKDFCENENWLRLA